MSQEERLEGGIVVHIVAGVYVCVALAVVCHYYFVPSLEAICWHLGIQPDVGGRFFVDIQKLLNWGRGRGTSRIGDKWLYGGRGY